MRFVVTHGTGTCTAVPARERHCTLQIIMGTAVCKMHLHVPVSKVLSEPSCVEEIVRYCPPHFQKLALKCA